MRVSSRVARHILVLIVGAGGVAAGHAGPRAQVAHVDEQLRGRPGDVELLLERAAVHRQAGHLREALGDLRAVARQTPARRELLLERGLVRLALGEMAAAEADLTRFLDGNKGLAAPSSGTATALVARAEAREGRRRPSQARDDYDAAARLRPGPEVVLARGRIDEQLGQLERAAEGYAEGLLATGGAVTVRLALVRVEGARGRHDRAIALLDEVIAVAPLKADWLLRRADVQQAAGRGDAARADREAALVELDQTLRRRPNDLARLARARACLGLGRRAEAIAELEIIVARSPLAEAQALLAEARRPLPHQARSQ